MLELDIEKIAAEYEKKLIIPDKKPTRQIILCPVGLVGAGKSTVMKPLCERLSLLRISNDEIREIIGDIRYFDNYPTQIATILINKYGKLGFSIGLDANCSTVWGSDKFNELLNQLGATAIWININPPEGYILNKLTNHQPSYLFRNTDEAIAAYDKSKETVRTEGIPFIYEFDPSQSNLNDQLEEAYQKIKSLL